MNKNHANRICALFLALLLLTACGAPREHSRSFFAMDTAMSLRFYGGSEALAEQAEELVAELEARLSVTRSGSELHALNRDGEGTLSAETAALLRRALELCGETGGALDVTIYPVLRAWGFTTGDYRVPTQTELDALLENVDYRRVSLGEDGSVALPDGMELDLGAVAKGYTGDLLCALLRDKGVESALLDLGGNIQALGTKPDGSPWRIGIRDPKGTGLLGVLEMRDMAVVTSGGYERYFEDSAGRLWWHILDPADGYPARSGLSSVTVIGGEGLRCDALSTALFVMGEEKAVEFWRARGDFDLVLARADGSLVITDGISDTFTPGQGRSAEVVKRDGSV